MLPLRAAIAAVVLMILAVGGASRSPADPAPIPRSSTHFVSAVLELPADTERILSSPDLMATAPEIPPGYVYWKTIPARVTAYEPSSRSCGKYADGFTSLGDNAWRMDGCAIDPRAIPYRTLVEIPGLGVREADDTGAAMRRSWTKHRRFHVDVRFPYVSQAMNWGVRTMDVKLYRKLETETKVKESDATRKSK